MFTVLEGDVVITDEEGIGHHIKVGDSIYIPRGTPIHWNIANRLKKAWVMMPHLDVAT